MATFISNIDCECRPKLTFLTTEGIYEIKKAKLKFDYKKEKYRIKNSLRKMVLK